MKKAKASMNFIIKMGIYPFDVMVSFGQSDLDLFKALNKYGITEDEFNDVVFDKSTIQGRSIMFPGNQSLLRMRTIPSSINDYMTLHHELLHIVSFIMFRVGIPLKVEVSDEAYCYLIGFLTGEIYKKI